MKNNKHGVALDVRVSLFNSEIQTFVMISSLSSMYLKPFFNGLPDMFNLQQGLPKLYFQIQL